MTDRTSRTSTESKAAWADALAHQGEGRQRQLAVAAEDLRREMETQAAAVRDLVLAQAPVELLGYVWARFHMSVIGELGERGDDYRPNKEVIQKYQFVFEYLHAVWSCFSDFSHEAALDQDKAEALFVALEELKSTTMMYCVASSMANAEQGEKRLSEDTEFHAKSAWVLMRGNRYQVLEREFFKFVLEPHADVLRDAYGMEVDAIADGIQAVADAMRTGFSRSIETIQEGMERTRRLQEESRLSLQEALETLKAKDETFAQEIAGSIQDVFHGGICSLTRHSKFTEPLLEDLSYSTGGNDEFFAEGEFAGTPMRTLPARIKPGVVLGGEHYVTDGQFFRDSAYRAIQRGLLARLPDYREGWNQRQKRLVELAFPSVFREQLRESYQYSEVFYRDPATSQWAESDLVIAVDDILLVVEAKAGAMAMDSPATNFDRHERAIRNLIVKAYRQCARFVEYLESANEVPLFHLVDGEYVEIARLRRASFRRVVPIGLTVEAYTPFSAMCKEFAEVQPLLGKHPFISMSVDDLFVLNRFLPATGELLHYLEVRQEVAGIEGAFLFDEIEHLGAYIEKNRFDMTIREQLQEADFVTWDSFGDVVDKHFEGEFLEDRPVPCQEYPQVLSEVLVSLDRIRPPGWLMLDASIRNLGEDGRRNVDRIVAELAATLQDHPVRRAAIVGDEPLQVWVCRVGSEPSREQMEFHGQAICLVSSSPKAIVLRISYSREGDIVGMSCTTFSKPTVVQTNYFELEQEAERQRGRIIDLREAHGGTEAQKQRTGVGKKSADTRKKGKKGKGKKGKKKTRRKQGGRRR